MFKSVLICVYLWLILFMPQTPQYDLLIRNGRIVDGSGRAGYIADLAIKGDRIVKIGKLSQATAARTIDAQGLVVAPGFIDMLGQSETYLLIDPRAMSKVMMGVTTEITGEGESIAPINERQIKEQEDFLRRFNLTIDWRSLDEYFKRLDKQGSGVNLGTFVGATQVREYVIGYDDRPPTPQELEQAASYTRPRPAPPVPRRRAGSLPTSRRRLQTPHALDGIGDGAARPRAEGHANDVAGLELRECERRARRRDARLRRHAQPDDAQRHAHGGRDFDGAGADVDDAHGTLHAVMR
jgi:hypothetical protein